MPDAAPSQPTERQRWIAAQCLAVGEGLAGAAAFAGIPLAVLRRLDAEDSDFQELYQAEIARARLPPEGWARRMELLTRQAIERALADGKVSTVNALLRTGLVLPDLVAPPSPQARARLARTLAALEEEATEAPSAAEAEAEPAAATPPPIEADPEREARRLELLATVKPALRPSVARADLALLEHFLAATDPDPCVYERWFAAQPKPPFDPIPLSEADKAAIRHVTRHNPPWLKGAYLGYYRPPVPAEVFAANANEVATTPAEPEAEAPQAPPAAAAARLKARLARLLDEAAVRLPEELDLAEAVCALQWPNWPAYKGPVDLGLLRRVLREVPLDSDALHRLGSTELARACLAQPAKDAMAQGP